MNGALAAAILILCAILNLLGAIFIYRAAQYNQASTKTIGEILETLERFGLERRTDDPEE